MILKLLILSTEFPPGPGGIGTHTYQLAGNLSKLGWQVVVVAPQDYASDQEVKLFNSIQPFRIVRLRMLPFIAVKSAYRVAVIWKQIRIWRPNLILAAGERAVWIAALFSGHIPVIAVGYGSEFGLAGWQRKLNRWAFQQVDHVISISKFTAALIAECHIVPRSASIIPCGADDSHFDLVALERVSEFRERYGFDQLSRLILTVGNVTDRKGQHVVIRALPHVLQEVPEAHYLIAGLPTMREQFSALAVSLGVADHVHFLGRVPHAELPILMNACDVFAMTSVNTASGDVEGYGIAAVEAALCGKPAVVSDGSGLAEAVLNEVTGFVVPQNDPEQTAKALITLLKDENLRQRMGMAARERALAEQTWTARAKAYDQLLRSFVS